MSLYEISTRRLIFLSAMQLILMVCLLIPLYWLQIREGKKYQLMSEKNRLSVRLIAAPRGQILDRYGIPLAKSKVFFRLCAHTRKTERLADLRNLLPPWIGFDQLSKVQKIRPGQYLLKDNLSWNDVACMHLYLSDVPELVTHQYERRFYPHSEVLSHFLGYISPPNQEEHKLFQIPRGVEDICVGKQGIERIFERQLSGEIGCVMLEVNAQRRVVRKVQQTPVIPGEEVKLSIDSRLQRYIFELLKSHESASAVVMSIKTGEILALVSIPSFNPNKFVDRICLQDWKELRQNSYKPLMNKALSGLYAPGSTIKMLLVLAGLELGVINMNTRIHCPGYKQLNDHYFHCWRKKGHGTLGPHQAITQSCDVFMYELGRRLGIKNIASVFKNFGLGEVRLDDFAESKTGLVPTKAWKQKMGYGSWREADTYNTSIGQGYMLSTTLELATMCARLATGFEVVPTYIFQENPRRFRSLPYREETLKFVQRSMYGVMNQPDGTAFRYRLEKFPIVGKSGTSQVRRISMEERKQGIKKNKDLPWHRRDHALFCGYGPFEDPKYAIAVIVEHGGSGSATASPIVRDIFAFLRDNPAL
jgi:penicillin-binding protein 2